ncbi:ArsR/SmtB family transcription factor [Streptomyces gamaensis]|uniref:ArsR/SmtB family transcription factor n=1 Tax=Streptomyces gamaensis TaxID=1763542 RepID=A0ABW0Z0S6_9ACTN
MNSVLRVSTQRIHFTLDDLLRVRVGTAPGSHVETFFALMSLDQPGHPALVDWRMKARQKLGQQRVTLLKQLPKVFPSPARLLAMLRGGAMESRLALGRLGVPAEQLASLVHDFWRIAVAPYWSRIRDHLHDRQGQLERLMAVGGVEHLLSNFMLSNLQGGGHWSTPVLELPHERDGDVRLDGRGLLLVPSLFLPQRPGHLLDLTDAGGQPALLFSAAPDDGTEALWEEPGDDSQALAALVGSTRASALEALVDGCTTGELAQRLGISAPGASQHTAVLRAAGLITTRRERNKARHALTPLGRALLRPRAGSEGPLCGTAEPALCT